MGVVYAILLLAIDLAILWYFWRRDDPKVIAARKAKWERATTEFTEKYGERMRPFHAGEEYGPH